MVKLRDIRGLLQEIKTLTQVIRNYSECELDYGTLCTLKKIDDVSDRLAEKEIKPIIEHGIKEGLIEIDKERVIGAVNNYLGVKGFEDDFELAQAIAEADILKVKDEIKEDKDGEIPRIY